MKPIPQRKTICATGNPARFLSQSWGPGAKPGEPGLGRSEAGTSLVEMALLTPLLALLLMGTIDVGRLAYLSIQLSNGARAGVQYGAQNPSTAVDNSGMQQAALDDAQSPTGMTATARHFCRCSDGSASTCLSTDCPNNRIIEWVQVDTSAPFQPLFTYPGLPGSVTLKGKAVMRVAD